MKDLINWYHWHQMWSPEFHLQILETFGRGHLEFGFLHILENLKGFTPQRRRNGSSLGHPDESTRDRPTPSGRDGRTSPLNAIVQPEDGMPQRPIVADCNEHLIASTGNLASLSWWFFFLGKRCIYWNDVGIKMTRMQLRAAAAHVSVWLW